MSGSQQYRDRLLEMASSWQMGFFKHFERAFAGQGKVDATEKAAGLVNFVFRFGDLGPAIATDPKAIERVKVALSEAYLAMQEDTRSEMAIALVIAGAAQQVPVDAFVRHVQTLYDDGITDAGYLTPAAWNSGANSTSPEAISDILSIADRKYYDACMAIDIESRVPKQDISSSAATKDLRGSPNWRLLLAQRLRFRAAKQPNLSPAQRSSLLRHAQMMLALHQKHRRQSVHEAQTLSDRTEAVAPLNEEITDPGSSGGTAAHARAMTSTGQREPRSYSGMYVSQGRSTTEAVPIRHRGWRTLRAALIGVGVSTVLTMAGVPIVISILVGTAIFGVLRIWHEVRTHWR